MAHFGNRLNPRVLVAIQVLSAIHDKVDHIAWFDGDRSNECVFLVNRAYGTRFPCVLPVGGGRTFGYSDWTHAPGGAALRRKQAEHK